MRVGIPAETRPGETRVAATPETVKKLVSAQHQVVVQAGAGISSSITDEAYAGAGAMLGSAADAFDAGMVLKVRAPSAEECARMKAGTVVVGMLNPFDAGNIEAMARAGLTAFALEAAPRIRL
jgi:NAD(P) transhydrogenase subunit alpha